VNDNLDSGRPPTAETSATIPVAPTAAAPTTMVFDGVGSLADSLLGPAAAAEVPEVAAPEVAAPEVAVPDLAVPDLAVPPLDSELPEVVTDEERTRYGLLLDRAAERGLLDPAEYEIRLRELAEATSTARMLEIVTELPAFTLPPATAARASRSVRTKPAAPGTGGQRRRGTVWVVLVVVVVIAVVSLVVLALSVERLSRTHGSGQSSPPVATQRLSAPRL
jgi:hypothetical protein